MASQKDLQDLLRILTTGRNKVPMLAAMGRVKALQAAGLRSVTEIASADIKTVQKAIADEKAAKSLQTACKASIKDPDKKRNAATALSSPAKRMKSAYELPDEPQSPEALEASLALPQPSKDEEPISKTVIYTNRAPLVLAFAVELLKFTMPEQPLSSRLSLAQAVVSANSRSKAVSLGLEKGASAESEGWGAGQPKVRILGREVHILKRSGYHWMKDELESEKEGNEKKDLQEGDQATSSGQSVPQASDHEQKLAITGWTISASVTLKQSTFVARSIAVSSSSEARASVQKLLAENKDLQEASHNITAWRVQGSQGRIIEECDDDGEKGGGSHLLELLRSNGTTGILLVVTRWYGGIMLGTDRWKLMSQVARDALSQRLRVTGIVGQEALWGLDLEGMRSTNAPVTGGTAAGMPIHKPEGARSYILKAFASPPSDEGSKKKKSGAALEKEKEGNLGLLLGALDMLFESWVEHIGRDELDRRAWGWYVQVRPDVESGVAGWGGKGEVRLKDILDLRRKG
ncbi:hypothetical protein F5884DRAFT_792256 [Xylogone sp. PMI_703]|nr:hypothetical protein F5884DRAFT_792256 [Xylogone sp. PMI_703]